MDKYKAAVNAIVREHGGYREKQIFSQPHTITHGHTWSSEHKVITITATVADNSGHRDAFCVDLVTGKICG